MMNNDWLNIAFGPFHFYWEVKKWTPRISKNKYWNNAFGYFNIYIFRPLWALKRAFYDE